MSEQTKDHEEKSIAITHKVDALAPFGSREDVRELARRIQIMAPGGKKLNEAEALALAQGAVMHGLDCFIGEIWYIPGSGLMAGINGRRKAARHQMGRGGNFRTEFDPITNPDERALYQIGNGDLAFKCSLFDSETTSAYVEGYAKLKKEGLPENLIPSLLGKRPFTLGIGVLKAGEKTKMEPVQCAMKRAETDALKRRFYLPFGSQGADDEDPIEGEWKLKEEEAKEAAAQMTPEQRKATQEALWGVDDGSPNGPGRPPESYDPVVTRPVMPMPPPPPEPKPTVRPTEKSVDRSAPAKTSKLPPAKPGQNQFAGENGVTPTTYWEAVKAEELSHDDGLKILEEQGGDRSRALPIVHSQGQARRTAEGIPI